MSPHLKCIPLLPILTSCQPVPTDTPQQYPPRQPFPHIESASEVDVY